MEQASLGARARLLAIVVGVVLLLSSMIVGIAFFTTVRAAQVAQAQAQGAQSTIQGVILAQTRASGSLSDYVITGRDRALIDHQAALAQSSQLLDELSVIPALTADVEAARSAQRAWISADVDPTLAAMNAGERAEAARTTNRRQAWTTFDSMVATTASLADSIDALTTQAYNDERSFARVLLIVLIASALLLGLTAVAVMVLTRRWVTHPLRHMRHEFERTTRDPHHAIAVTGPRELQDIGTSAEELRRSLVDEMDRALAARQGLEDEAPLAAAVAHELEQPDADHYGDVSWAGTNRPSAGIASGDWWQVWPLRDGSVALVIADVSGHGPAAAVTALRARTLVRATMTSSGSLLATMDLLSEFHTERTNSLTMFLAVLDPLRNTLTWVNAGHHAPVVLSARGEVNFCTTTGPLISAVGGTWQVASRIFVRGDLLVAFTDGLVEKNNEHADSALIADYVRNLDARVRSDPWEVITRLGAAIRELSPDWSHDDVTILGAVRVP